MLHAFVLTVIWAVPMLTDRAGRGRVLGITWAGFSAAPAVLFALVGLMAGFCGIGPARAVSLAGAGGLLTVALLRSPWPFQTIVDAP